MDYNTITQTEKGLFDIPIHLFIYSLIEGIQYSGIKSTRNWRLGSSIGTASNITQVTRITLSLFSCGEMGMKTFALPNFQAFWELKWGNMCSAGYMWGIVARTMVRLLFSTCVILVHLQLVALRCFFLLHEFSLVLSWMLYRQNWRWLIDFCKGTHRALHLILELLYHPKRELWRF